MIKQNFVRGMLRVLCAVLIFSAVLEFIFWIPSPGAYAGTTAVSFDETDPLDDLRSSDDFDVLNYPFDESKGVGVLNFVEYCYTYKVNMQKNFGLYLYIYNPKGLEFETVNAGNKAQLAVSWGSDGTPASYEKFDLKFCAKSEETDYKRLFYKFKIVDHESADGKTILKRLNSAERRYDLSGVELVTKGAANAVEYTVGGTYRFIGYSKGYGSDATAESTLASTVTDLETVRLDVGHTFWRDGSMVTPIQQQIDTAYFAVPDRLLEDYGSLQKVKCEWYEYRTEPIVVTSDAGLYGFMQNYMGVMIPATYDGSIKYALHTTTYDFGGLKADWGWNASHSGPIGDFISILNCKVDCTKLCYIFETDGAEIPAFYLSGEELRSYILNYTASSDRGYLPIKNGQVSADLFETGLSEARAAVPHVGENVHHKLVELDSDSKFDLLVATDERGFWDKFWGRENVGSELSQVDPILQLADGDLSSGWYIDAHDVQTVQNYRDDARTHLNPDTNLIEPRTTFVLRYAVTDYYSQNLHFSNDKTGSKSGKAFVAKENVFLDFDIIQLTFNKDGQYHVIAAVSNPIDAIGGITPPPASDGCTVNWTLVISIVLILFLLWLLRPVLVPVLGAVGEGLLWIIKLPFRLIVWPFKAIANRKNGKEKK